MPVGVRVLRACLTLCADQHQRQVGRVPEAGEAAEIMINCLEAVLVLQAEHEDHGINPQSKLMQRVKGNVKEIFSNTALEIAIIHWFQKRRMLQSLKLNPNGINNFL